MTAFVVSFGAKTATVGADTLAYLPNGDPVGFVSKVLALPHIRSVLFSRGQFEITAAAWGQLHALPDLTSVEQAAELLPQLLRDEAERFCQCHRLGDHKQRVLIEVVLIGWSAKKKRMALWQFLNTADFVPQQATDAATGNVFTWPTVPERYAPKQAAGRSLDAVMVEGMMSARRYFAESAAMRHAKVGGEVVAYDISAKGIGTRILHRFDDYDEVRVASSAICARVMRGALDPSRIARQSIYSVDDPAVIDARKAS